MIANEVLIQYQYNIVKNAGGFFTSVINTNYYHNTAKALRSTQVHRNKMPATFLLYHLSSELATYFCAMFVLSAFYTISSS